MDIFNNLNITQLTTLAQSSNSILNGGFGMNYNDALNGSIYAGFVSITSGASQYPGCVINNPDLSAIKLKIGLMYFHGSPGPINIALVVDTVQSGGTTQPNLNGGSPNSIATLNTYAPTSYPSITQFNIGVPTTGITTFVPIPFVISEGQCLYAVGSSLNSSLVGGFIWKEE